MTKRAWAVCDKRNRVLLHSIKATRRELMKYVDNWCLDRAGWKRVSTDGSYQIKRITITVD